MGDRYCMTIFTDCTTPAKSQMFFVPAGPVIDRRGGCKQACPAFAWNYNGHTSGCKSLVAAAVSHNSLSSAEVITHFETATLST
jgi:hypothetical protein